MQAESDPDERLREVAGRVYRSDPDRFVEERDRLVRELREQDDRELARAVGGLRKPTLAAWAVDQLALRDGDDVAELFRCGEAARAALQDRDRPVREAMADLREAVAALRDRAGGYLDDIGATRDTHLDDVASTLRTAAVDPAQRAEVAAGMLTRPLSTSGFGALSGLELAGGASAEGDAQREQDEPADEESAQQRLREERRRLGRRADQLRERRDEAEETVRELRGRAEEARRRAQELDARAEEAQQAAQEPAAELAEVDQRLQEIDDQLGRA